MKFEKYDIDPRIKENLIANGLHRTTDIQFKTIPAILNGEDVLAVAQTGSGKTAAFAIPILHQVIAEKRNRRGRGLHCLVLVPTRELAQQIGRVFAMLSKKTGATSYAVYGGVEQDAQIAQLAGGVDILVATPGRMFDLIRRNHIETDFVRTLVLDEADRMLDLGFIEDIEAVKKRLKQRHQTLFFSATINPKIKKLAYSQIRANALRIQVSPADMVSKNITHSIVKVDMDEKRHLLIRFLGMNPEAKVIIFVRTQVRAERVGAWLAKNEVGSVSMHGGMEQSERERQLEAFRDRPTGVLIATDVTARGIDLPGITHVVNYDLPDNPENYVHRIGRTGRGFAKGRAVSFWSPEETDKLANIEELLETKLHEEKVDPSLFEPVSMKPVESMSMAELLESAGAGSEEKKKRGKKRK
ncbi:MAG TPA: DEAD/DEAH box helicase [Pseudobdellovibrionaceae bacterium]|nr:DEAD/DEAH box helicase [Pseudobdellovibrionaceae bacterium]